MVQEKEKQALKQDSGKIMTFALIGVNIVVLCFGTFLVYASTIGKKKVMVLDKELEENMVESRKALPTDPMIFSLKTLNANLDGVPRRMIRIQVNLEMLDEEGFEEVISLGAEARDSIIRIINSKKFTDVESIQGKLHLKSQIKAKLNSYLKKGVVKQVYFSDFAIQ